jgi:hypothetical protein
MGAGIGVLAGVFFGLWAAVVASVEEMGHSIPPLSIAGSTAALLRISLEPSRRVPRFRRAIRQYEVLTARAGTARPLHWSEKVGAIAANPARHGPARM